MDAMRIEIASIASSLMLRRRGELLRDAFLPQSVRSMIGVHLEKPWIPNFWSIAIRATRSGSDGFLDFPIGHAEDGTFWFFPSRSWWVAHAQANHPPAGAGCDVESHVKFLTSGGAVHEFDYAVVTKDGLLTVLDRANFAEECTWWTRAFGAPEAEQ